jgi:hypothetical protein
MAEIGFPAELSSKLDYSAPAEVSSLDVRIYPNNISSVQSSIVVSPATGNVLDIPLPTSTFTFALPTGAGKGQFLDHRFTRFNFRVNYEITTAATGTVPTVVSTLRSGAHAWVQRMWEESQSGVVVSDQPNYDILADMDAQFGYDVAQRDANATSLGFEANGIASDGTVQSSVNSNTGHTIVPFNASSLVAVGSYYNAYSIPVMSPLIGAWAKKFFQIGAVNRHTLNVQLPPLAPITYSVTTAAGTSQASLRVTIDQVSLSLRLVNIPMDALRMIGKASGTQYYNGTVGRVASQSLGTTAGAQSWLVGIRGSSVKNLITRFTEGVYTTAGCVNRQFDSKMPLYTSIAYNVNGVNMPAAPDDLVRSPAMAFSRTQMALAQFNAYDFKSGITPGAFCRYLPSSNVPTDVDGYLTLAGTASTPRQLAAFHYGVNLERIAKAGILSGMNLNSSSTYLNVNSGSSAPTNAVIAYFIALLDSLIIHDLETGELSVRL